MRKYFHSRGITLIEVLVAVTIFAVLGIMSYRAVSQAIDNRTRLETEFSDWQRLARALGRVEADLQQIGARYVSRSTRVPNNVANAAASILANQSPIVFKLLPDGSSRLLFWRLDVEQGARLSGFEFANGSFDLLRWPTADTTQAPKREQLLTGVSSVHWGFVSPLKPEWLANWPASPGQAGEVPLGISIEIAVDKFGKINRVFAIN